MAARYRRALRLFRRQRRARRALARRTIARYVSLRPATASTRREDGMLYASESTSSAAEQSYGIGLQSVNRRGDGEAVARRRRHAVDASIRRDARRHASSSATRRGGAMCHAPFGKILERARRGRQASSWAATALDRRGTPLGQWDRAGPLGGGGRRHIGTRSRCGVACAHVDRRCAALEAYRKPAGDRARLAALATQVLKRRCRAAALAGARTRSSLSASGGSVSRSRPRGVVVETEPGCSPCGRLRRNGAAGGSPCPIQRQSARTTSDPSPAASGRRHRFQPHRITPNETFRGSVASVASVDRKPPPCRRRRRRRHAS